MQNKGLQINKELALKKLLVAPKIPTWEIQACFPARLVVSGSTKR
jgi:hypothetical protein